MIKVLLFWCISGLLIALLYVGLISLAAVVAPRQSSVSSEPAKIHASEIGAGDLGLQEADSLADLREDAGSEAEGNTEKTDTKTAALTFDDGPHPVYTRRLLDGLLERGVHATFFVVGENIPGNEDLIARMEAEGHLIGNHTYDHVKISDMSQEEACRQVEQTSALVREITGHDTEFVRPPFGEWKKNMECSFTMIPVLWDVDPLDWTTSDVSLVVERVVKQTEDQDIILMHDCYDSSVAAALQIVDILQEMGYEFVTADQLVLD